MKEHTDAKNLITNRVRTALEILERERVGHIDLEDSEGLVYQIDNVQFCVSIQEVECE